MVRAGFCVRLYMTQLCCLPSKLFQPFSGVSQGYQPRPVFRNLPKSWVALRLRQNRSLDSGQMNKPRN